MEKKKGNESYYDTFESPVGTLSLVFTGKVLIGVTFKKPTGVIRKGEAPSLIKKDLREYFENGRQAFTQKIDFAKGTGFDRSVWLALKEVPYGETRTYKWLSLKVWHPTPRRG